MPLRSGADLPELDFLDTTDCENEPIRFPGAIQPHGVLLALDKTTREIVAVSENCAGLLGFLPSQLLGNRLDTVSGLDQIQSFCFAESASGQNHPELITHQGKAISVRSSTNETGQILIDIEFPEKAADSVVASAFKLRGEATRLSTLTDISEIADFTAKLVHKWTGFDRVMLYRFDSKWNGEVIAEACNEEVDRYLGLCFPASDIPKQARDMFKSKPPRLITDTLRAPSGLSSSIDPSAIDLGPSEFRAVSPIHIRYLMNMRVRATLVCSLVVDGNLWGLISCHNLSGPKYVDPLSRQVLSWISDDIASRFGHAQSEAKRRTIRALTDKRYALMSLIRSKGLRSAVRDEGEPLLRIVNSDGFVLLADDFIEACGLTPCSEDISAIGEYVKERHQSENVFATNNLANALQGRYFDENLAGALVVKLTDPDNVMLMWFRRERRHQVSWAGNPSHAHQSGQDGRLSPRESFDHFIQEVTGFAADWLPEELESAAELTSLIEVHLFQEQRALTQTFMDSSPDSTVLLDSSGRIIATNRAWNDFGKNNGGGSSQKDFIGRYYKDSCRVDPQASGADTALTAWRGIEAVLRKEIPSFFFDYPCHTPNKKRWFQMRVYPLLWPKEGVVITHQEVTFQRELIEELKALDIRKDEFLATLAHELRNPLAPVHNGIQAFMASDMLAPGGRGAQMLSIMERQSKQLVRLLDDLMEISRIRLGKVELHFELTDIGALLRSAIDSIRFASSNKKQELVIDIPLEVISTFADPTRISQILSNLLNNAIKFTPDKGSILVKVLLTDREVDISIRDSGPGIAPEALKTIFDMFSQGAMDTHTQSGLGIGLALSAKLASMHGGRIEAKSEGPDKGSEFILSLPLLNAEGTKPNDSLGGIKSTRRVLIIDDEVDVAEGLRFLLEVFGAQVRVTNDGFAGLRVAEEFKPSFIFVDLGMPGMGGLEVCKRLRENPLNREVQIIALTGWGQEEDRLITRSVGFNLHLTKPASLETLRELFSE